MERLLERLIFSSRWLMAPIYLGLSLILVLLGIKFFQRIYDMSFQILELESMSLVVKILSLLDITLVGGLIVMVMLAGYENFVSRLDLDDDEAKPSWLGKMDSSSLKNKVAASIVAISSIHLLKVFIDVEKIPDDKLLWYLLIHVTFVVTAFVMGYLDKVTRH
ncbi:TIGR00645 family protein [Parendozoicomonas haliclonae]|uniref:UPF0114 protein EHSB41UT_04491 n=1 Tax=Parendozoicomonas haliclonae TaxID=1960125 RepID=A0A1X7AQT4_9GAMM|nr:TIGR00645 family protein [Parendozoicomonas haliclonae]SMA50674.1 hypothetical protein EHSB41UT_04491 [Parendozoicomonas haliclonae]